MSPEQCRQARERLQWTACELAAAADVPSSVVVDFEGNGSVSDSALLDRVGAVLEDVGIGFPFELSGGKAQPAGITYSPRDRSATH